MKLILRMRKSKAGREDQQPKDKLEYFRRLILDHLTTLEDGSALEKGAKMPVGTIREWKGKKYIKIGPNKWRPKYDSQSRGAKLAVAAIRRKVEAAKDAQEMMRIVLENRDRFSDQDGHPLPFVQELSAYIREQGDARGAGSGDGKAPVEGDKNNQRKPAKQPEAEPAADDRGESGGEKILEAKKPREKEPEIAAEGKDKQTILNLKDNIHKILHGTKEEKEKLDGQFFRLAGTPQFMKDLGLKGDFFEIRYGVIARHMGKDANHNLSEETWKGLYDAIAKPFAIAKHDKGFRIFTEIKTDGKYVVAGVQVKNIGKGLEINSISTAFGYEKQGSQKNIIYRAENITPEQTALLDGLNSLSLPPEQGDNTNIPNSSEKSSDFAQIRETYQSAKAIEGDEDEIQVGREIIAGRWKLVEADTPTASHDETTFHKTPGFPTNPDGSSINDRDYEHFEANKEAVLDIAGDFDGRALGLDNPVMVTEDGIVISGNNRTMSSKLAAHKGTDAKYIEALKKKARKFGFSPDALGQFKHPRVIFETAQNGDYTTAQFAQFNESGSKEMGPTEKAAKVSKMIKADTIEAVAEKINEFETIGELYQNAGASREIYNLFRDAGLIGEHESGRYFENGALTEDGKTFIETALLGTVINEANLRGFNRPGCKSIRATLMRALVPLVENKGLKGYSINTELNAAVDIAMQVAINKDKFKNVEDFSKQDTMFESLDPVAVELAKRLEGTQKSFADFMQSMNGGLKVAANGEVDIFLGEVESKEAIINRMMHLKSIKKAIDRALQFFRGLKLGPHGWLAKGGFVEGEHPRDGDGKFSESGGAGEGKKPPKFEKIPIGKAEQWLVDEAKEVGLNIEGFEHEITNEFMNHVMNRHGDEKKESKQGQIAIQESDFEKIPEILKSPDYLMVGAKSKGFDLLVYTKKQEDGTTIYFEEVLDSKRNKSLRGKTMYKWKGEVSKENLKPVVTNNGKTDISEAKIVSLGADGGNPAGAAITKESLVVANPTETQDLPKISQKSGEKSSDIDDLQKSLTYSGYPLQGRTKVQGMDVSIENKKGSVRSGTDKDGHAWSVKMYFDYGYIRGTVGVDKDHLDCYVGPNPESEIVYIVNQHDPVTGVFDEQKVMLGFNSEAEAKAAYLKQYDRPGFFGSILKMDIDTFKAMAFDRDNKGKPITKKRAA